MSLLTPSVLAWRDRGRFATLAGQRVFLMDAGPRDAQQTIVVLHGFPTSSHDWHRALPRLSDGRRVVLLDLPGYGLSAKPVDYSYSLFEQADIVLLALRELGVERCHLLAHDMGTSIASELMARRERGLLPLGVDSLVLMNGSVHIELAKLTPSQRLLRSRAANVFARVGSRRIFRLQMRRILGKPLSDDDLDDMWAQIRYADGKLRLPQIMSYIDERYRFWHRWIGALSRLNIPTLVLWGPEDTVAVPAIAQQLADEIPGSRLQWLDGLGHYPMLEDSDQTTEAILGFLEKPGSW